ncbi:hypothetical protein PISL3812_06511 [Talaromyces islandicus]|uniref:BTB domain-containing protein n=1 Tax=Talaromyces islandicus TaxID=28573 RepID=A0A0U1M1N3_TALIS|nr:hypothetical protein PISL3812_06511 [Talaromyces islandicus]
MLRVPLSEVRCTAVDHELTDIGDALIILLNPCTEIASESPSPAALTPPPRGEKRLKVKLEEGNEKVMYRVASHCLAQASSYFRCIFNGIEEDETCPYHADFGIRLEILQEWDPAALLAIFQIFHFQFNKVLSPIADVDSLGKLVVMPTISSACMY